jgi:HEAT repeat protein
MSRRAGRRCALGAAGVAAAVLAWQGVIWVQEELLIRELGSDDPVAVVAAARRLAAMRCTRAVPRMLEAIESKRLHAFDRSDVAGAIADVGPAAVPALVGLVLEQPDGYAARTACRRLGELGGRSPLVVATLVRALESPRLAETAAEALVRLGPAAIPALTEAAREQSWPLQDNAKRALGRIRPARQ